MTTPDPDDVKTLSFPSFDMGNAPSNDDPVIVPLAFIFPITSNLFSEKNFAVSTARISILFDFTIIFSLL